MNGVRRMALRFAGAACTLALAACAAPSSAPAAPPARPAAEVSAGQPFTTPAPRWRLLVFQAFRPGVLSLCRDAHRWPQFAQLARPEAQAPGKAWWWDGALAVRWQGGQFSHGAGDPSGPAPASASPADHCFALFVDGVPVLSGAVLHAFSARLLDFPTLVLDARAGEPVTHLTLLPRFPGQLAERVQAWEMLRALEGETPAPRPG